jgi:hypothetical protein
MWRQTRLGHFCGRGGWDRWTKHLFCLKKTIQGLQKKAADEGSPIMQEVVDVLELTHQQDCDKATFKMVDWMMQQGLIPQEKMGDLLAILFCS